MFQWFLRFREFAEFTEFNENSAPFKENPNILQSYVHSQTVSTINHALKFFLKFFF